MREKIFKSCKVLAKPFAVSESYKKENKGSTLFVTESAEKTSYRGSTLKFHLINNGQTHH